MPAKAREAQTAMAACIAWYAVRGEDIRQITERTEQLWFQMDDHVAVLQKAECSGSAVQLQVSLQALLDCALALQAEAQQYKRRLLL